MFKILRSRLKQGCATIPFPAEAKLPQRFRGLPKIHPERCGDDCIACEKICPSQAISLRPLTLDLGKCIFCEECVAVCPNKAIEYSRDIKMSVRKREELLLRGDELKLATALDKKMQKIFKRSLKLRVVSAGSCSGCEMELNAINNIQFDISRFGIQVVASPRHADGLIVAGHVSDNMKLALEKTYNAVASPKIVIAVGACATGGGLFENQLNLPVDLYIPGCPPHPLTMLDGMLRLLKTW